MKRLNGKTVMVTGSAKGIGKGCAKAFAEEGANVVVADIDRKNGEETANEFKNRGLEAAFFETNVTKPDSFKESIDKTVKEYGGIDVLHNNAGVYAVSPSDEVTVGTWDKILDINLKGAFLGCKYAIPQMKKQKEGVILNTGSECGVSGFPNTLPYNVSKAGIINLTKTLAAEFAPDIRVNCISPARVWTPMHKSYLGELPDDEAEKKKKQVEKTIPIGRWLTPEDIASVATFLASSEASAITGANILVDGGTTSTVVWGEPLPELPAPSEL